MCELVHEPEDVVSITWKTEEGSLVFGNLWFLEMKYFFGLPVKS